jgi:hypothetical protein
MKGATADPPVMTINMPNKINININGSSQNFFLSFKNPHKSLKKSIDFSLF